MFEHPDHDPMRPPSRRPMSPRADGLGDGPDAAPDPALSMLMEAVNAAPTARELAGQQGAIEAFLAHAALHGPDRTTRLAPRRERCLRSPRRLAAPTLVAGRVAVVTLAGVLTLGATTAAALTGTLPGPLQALVHQVVGLPRTAVPPAPARLPAGTRREHPASTDQTKATPQPGAAPTAADSRRTHPATNGTRAHGSTRQDPAGASQHALGSSPTSPGTNPHAPATPGAAGQDPPGAAHPSQAHPAQATGRGAGQAGGPAQAPHPDHLPARPVR